MERSTFDLPSLDRSFRQSRIGLAQLARMIGKPTGPAALLADRRQSYRAALLAAESRARDLAVAQPGRCCVDGSSMAAVAAGHLDLEVIARQVAKRREGRRQGHSPMWGATAGLNHGQPGKALKLMVNAPLPFRLTRLRRALQEGRPLHQLWPIVLHIADLGADFPSLDRAAVGLHHPGRYFRRVPASSPRTATPPAPAASGRDIAACSGPRPW